MTNGPFVFYLLNFVISSNPLGSPRKNLNDIVLNLSS